MVRRWLIRGFFLALLLLWAAGWGVSTRYWARSDYIRGGKRLSGGVGSGVVSFTWERGLLATDSWHSGLVPHRFHLVGPGFWWRCYSSADANSTISSFCLVGFFYAHDSVSFAPAKIYVRHTVGVPFWFLLLVSGIALRWAWRKTRPQPSPATAFPVETTGGQA